jgi:hypothetical protein
MKRRHMVLINLIFVSLMMFSAGMVYQFMTGNKPLAALANLKHDTPVTVETTGCNDKPSLDLSGVQSNYLRKLSVYQQACHSYATNTMMIFVGMPATDKTAVTAAQQDAATIKEFSKYHIRPLVMAEPTDYMTDAQIDFAKFSKGSYAKSLDLYFSTLKAAGITDQDMGIWGPFPEANLPYWLHNDAQYFAPSVNIYVSTLRKYFPKAQTTIMLNTATYQPTDFDWANGDYVSWLPYIKGIKPGTIDYAGLEGFPWVAKQGGSGSIINAAEFLNPNIISEAADYLGTKNIWFNTGTFSEKYALDPGKIAYMAPQQRKAILSTITEQATILQKKGYDLSVNIFAENKSQASEETNWSYWSNDDPFSSLAAPVLTDFVHGLNEQHIDFWLFDK